MTNAMFDWIEAFSDRQPRHSKLDYPTPVWFEINGPTTPAGVAYKPRPGFRLNGEQLQTMNMHPTSPVMQLPAARGHGVKRPTAPEHHIKSPLGSPRNLVLGPRPAEIDLWR